MRIALAGNPNSGKTTMFNALTGQNEKVGNWAGVTVDKKVHAIKKSLYRGEKLIAIDLPGAYSISPFTSEESITRDFVKNENPDAIINIVDATNLSRSLFFTTQLLELGIPMVVALNKTDVNEKKHNKIDAAALSKELGCPVIETAAASRRGLREVVKAAAELKGKSQAAPYSQGADPSDKAAAESADRARFNFVNGIVERVEERKVFTNQLNFQDKIDALITNKWLGIPIFAVVIALVFMVSQHEKGLGVFIGDYLTHWIGLFQSFIASLLEGANPLISALLVDGIIGGVGAVVGFLPLVMVMYFLIALLEDCGYMARATVVLDPIFKKVGLSGKSAIPFVIGTGCAIPGVMACRTIKNERERRATAMLAPFMPCGAKLPVIALFAGTFFENASWVGTLMYFAGIVIIFLGALLINKITGNSAKKSFFIIELPEYKLPSLSRAFKSMCSRGWSYIVKAATIILVCNTAVQLMQSFTWSLSVANETSSDSILASVAGIFSYLLIPVVGVVSWQLAAAAITGFIAKENVVGTLAVCFGVSHLTSADIVGINGSGQVVSITAAAALAFLIFNLFSPPCFAAIGAMNSELRSKKWLFGGIVLQLAVGFTAGFLVFQIGTLITTGAFGAGFVGGLVAVLAFAAVIVCLCIRADRQVKAEAAAKAKVKAAKQETAVH